MQKGSMLIIVLLAGIIILAGGVYYFGKSSSNPQSTTTASTPSPISSASAQPSQDVAANWKTYQGTTFSLQYPPEWKLVIGPTMITPELSEKILPGVEALEGIYLSSRKGEDLHSVFVDVFPKPNKTVPQIFKEVKEQENSFKEKYKDKYIKDFKVDTVSINGLDTQEFFLSGQDYGWHLLVAGEKYMALITFWNNPKDNPLENKILASFKVQ